jgi:hypothetical protein
MNDDLARLRRRCIDTARALARGHADAWADASRVAADISDPPAGTPLRAEHFAAGDRLVDALMTDGRRPAVERLLDCARVLSLSAHERLGVEVQAEAIIRDLEADEGRRARGTDQPPR